MTPQDVLENLRALQRPQPDAGTGDVTFVWWPLIAITFGIGVLSWLAWRRRRAWRKEALAVLRDVESDALSGHTETAWTRLALLLRQLVVVAKGPQSQTAAVSGDAWLSLLDEIFASDFFREGPGRHLLTRPYQVNTAGPVACQDADLTHIVTFLRRNLCRIKPR